MKNKSYKLVPFGRGDAAAALCKICAEGEIGEPLLRSGFTKRLFCEFIAKLVLDRQAKGKPIETIIDALMLVDCSNMSAAKQSLAACSLHFEKTDANGESILDGENNPTWEEKAMSVETYWDKQGGPKSKVNLSALD